MTSVCAVVAQLSKDNSGCKISFPPIRNACSRQFPAKKMEIRNSSGPASYHLHSFALMPLAVGLPISLGVCSQTKLGRGGECEEFISNLSVLDKKARKSSSRRCGIL
jgi:hypothetical protein